jgi:hypothetical protein
MATVPASWTMVMSKPMILDAFKMFHWSPIPVTILKL